MSSSYHTGPGEAPMLHTRKLYIKNLEFRVIPEDIKEKFSEFGNILSCDVPRDQTKPDYCCKG